MAKRAKNQYSWRGFEGIPQALEALKVIFTKDSTCCFVEHRALPFFFWLSTKVMVRNEESKNTSVSRVAATRLGYAFYLTSYVSAVFVTIALELSWNGDGLLLWHSKEPKCTFEWYHGVNYVMNPPLMLIIHQTASRLIGLCRVKCNLFYLWPIYILFFCHRWAFCLNRIVYINTDPPVIPVRCDDWSI